MTIFRVQKKENYVVLDKGFLNDTCLSWKAKGLLAYMLSLPNDWTFSIADLATRSKCGRDATGNIVKELTVAGYIHKEQGRAERGKFGKTELLVFETPQVAPSTEKPLTVNPSTEKPQTEEPLTEKPSLLINKLLNNNLLNKNNNDDKSHAPAYAEEKQKPITAFQFYEQNGFGILTPHIGDKIGAWIDDMSETLVIHAMERAIENNVLKWNYVESILRDWENKRFTSLADIFADDKRRDAAKQVKAKQQTSSRKGREELVPDWFYKRNEGSAHVPNTGIEPVNQVKDFEVERGKILSKLGGGPA